MTATSCPSDEAITAWAEGTSEPAERDEIESHATDCARCRATIAALRGVRGDDELRIGAGQTQIDRYRILCPIGEGAMGVVLRAHDPVLDREIAIKMVNAHALDAGQQQLMLDEAKSLARLGHRNVVTVYDAGVLDGEVFVAMEYVSGQTFDRWLAATLPPWATRVAILADIGRGIAAVHQAGLIHRDLKPSNVLVDDSGRAVLIDFGLAREIVRAPTGAGSGVVGTPRYLAPELIAGERASAASDQYAWWLMVRDALRDESVTAGIDTKTRRKFDAIVSRGLAAKPTARFPSMIDAVEAVERAALARPRRSASLGLLALLIVGVTTITSFAMWSRHRVVAADACDAVDPPEWTPARRAEIIEHLGHAGADATRVIASLDVRAAKTRDLRQQACREARSARAEDRALAAHRLACVESRWREASAIFPGLVENDDQTVRSALDELGTVMPVARCGSGALPSEPMPPPDADRIEVARLQGELRSATVTMLDNPTKALEAIDALAPAITKFNYDRLSEAFHRARANVLRGLGRLDDAIAELHTTSQIAQRCGDDDTSARVSVDLLRMALLRGDADTATLEHDAAVAVDRLGNPAIASYLAGSVGMLRVSRGKPEEAVAALTKAVALCDSLDLGPSQSLINNLQNLAAAQQTTGQFQAAQTTFDRTVAAATARFGENSREALIARGARATNALYQNDPASAFTELQTVAVALTALAGNESPEIAQSWGHACEAAIALGQIDDALQVCNQAVLSGDATFGEGHPQTIWPLMELGKALMLAARPRDAVAPLQRALTIAQRATIDDADLPNAQLELAIARHRAGDHRAAVTALAQAAAQSLAAMPPARGSAGLAELRAEFPSLRW